MSHRRDVNWNDLIPGVNQTTWDLDVMSRESPSAPITVVQITYQRTPEEIEFRARLQTFVNAVTADSESRNLAPGLIRAADSSPLYLRECLRRFHPSKASIAVGEISVDEQVEPEDPEEEPRNDSDQLTPRSMQYFDAVSKLQESLDELSVDSKLEAMLKYIGNEKNRQSHVLVWCKFIATAQYLKSALTESDRNVFLITSGQHPSEQLTFLEQFTKRGGFLVATLASMKGLEVSADSIFIYDTIIDGPQNALYIALTRVRSQKPVEIVSIGDESAPSTFPDAFLRSHVVAGE